MATGKKEREGTSLCRESTNVGTLVGDQTKPSRQRRKTPMQERVRASSTSVSTCTAGAR